MGELILTEVEACPGNCNRRNPKGDGKKGTTKYSVIQCCKLSQDVYDILRPLMIMTFMTQIVVTSFLSSPSRRPHLVFADVIRHRL